MYKKLLVILMLCFTAVIYGNDRKIIKAYEKGKPAEMKIEVTKVKSDNYLDLVIDRLNKKFYKDITGQDTDLKRNLYITDTLERINSVADLRNEYPYKVVEYNGKKYLEVDYLGKPEPENIYFWVTKGNKIKKLYTGEVVDEYLDLTRAEAHVILKEEQSEKGKFDKISEESIIIKIGEIEHRKESQEAIKLNVAQNRYVLKGEETGGIIPVELYFDKDGTKEIVLDKNNRKTTLYGKIDVNTKDDYNLEKYNLVDDKNSNGSFSIKADFSTRLLSRSAVNSGYLNTVYKLNPRAMVTQSGSVGEINCYIGLFQDDGTITFKKYGWFVSIQVDLPDTTVKLTDIHFDLDFIEKFELNWIEPNPTENCITIAKQSVEEGELVLNVSSTYWLTHDKYGWGNLLIKEAHRTITYNGKTLYINPISKPGEESFEGRITKHMRFEPLKEGEEGTAEAEMVFINSIDNTKAKFILLDSNYQEITNGEILLKRKTSQGTSTPDMIVQLQEINESEKDSGNKYIQKVDSGRYRMLGKIESDQSKGRLGEYTGNLILRITTN